MAVTRSAEEAKRNYISVMGEPLGSLFHALWQEVAWLHRKWDEYVELYGTKATRVDLLNQAAPAFFRIVEDLLWEETLLHIARLTERRRSTLTIQRLHVVISDAATRATVKSLTHKAWEASEFCRDWRNRRIAHRDFNLAVEEGAVPLTPGSREKVKLALDAIVEVLNAVTRHYMDSTSLFDVGGHAGGALSMLYVIDDGLRAEAGRRERLSAVRYGQVILGTETSDPQSRVGSHPRFGSLLALLVGAPSTATFSRMAGERRQSMQRAWRFLTIDRSGGSVLAVKPSQRRGIWETG